jgi:hypothetical protein
MITLPVYLRLQNQIAGRLNLIPKICAREGQPTKASRTLDSMRKGEFMLHNDKDPFGYSLSTYAWVIGVAVIGGAVKYLNDPDKFSFLRLFRDLTTAGFAGILTFWLCEWLNITGPLSAVLIAVSGLMGTQALKEMENLYLARLGLNNPTSADKREGE